MTDQERKDAIRFFERVAEDEAMNYSRLAIEALSSSEIPNSSDTIYRQVAIDALKSNDIIACGDCKHYIPHDKRCGYWNHGVKPLMWCSQAERRWRE